MSTNVEFNALDFMAQLYFTFSHFFSHYVNIFIGINIMLFTFVDATVGFFSLSLWKLKEKQFPMSKCTFTDPT